MTQRVMRTLSLLSLLAAIATATGCRGCDRSSVPARPDAAVLRPSDPDVSPDAPAAPPAARDAMSPDARVRMLLEELPKHGKCSLLMGCPAADELLRHGERAVLPLVAFYRETSGEKYWRQRVLDLLGRLRDPRPIPLLLERLAMPGEILAADVALALGHLEAKEAHELLVGRHEGADPRVDPGLRIATAYALLRIGDERYRDELGRWLAPPSFAALNPWAAQTALTVVRWLGERAHAPTVLAALASANQFVRREAVRIALDWRLREAIPALIERLEDASPGVRAAALAALRELTGFEYKTTRAQWIEWCQKDGPCRP